MGDAELTDQEQQARRDAVRDIFPQTPFIGLLGIEIDRYEPDDITMRVKFRHELTNDGKVYHGGVISSAIDTAGALAAWSNHDFNKGARAATVAINVQYLGAARESDLVCHAKAVKRGKELIFTEIHATDDGGNPVAHGLQTYRIV
ncbi:MAG: hypothetical protein JJLCMIEE_02042 [Acidimicrobiales bacterium]|nr:MAG: PaaI family thioesterase [Actinomycetota bacterium]MBV6508975.1 hypothetical protein [Acidimicrobiales bacterium]RIK08390.1 MAG: thioesterase [Acidobacteriota bacterium]